MSEPASSSPQPDPPTAVARRPFQFRLRTLFFLTTLVAVFLAGLTGPSSAVRVLTTDILVLVVAVILLTLAVYTRGYFRTFCIGAIPPVAYLWFGSANLYGHLCNLATANNVPPENGFATWFYLLLGVVAGLFAMVLHWSLGLSVAFQAEDADCRQWDWRIVAHSRLRMLFVAAVLSPVLIGGLSTISPSLATLGGFVVRLTLAITILVGAVHGRGNFRYFCLGSMITQLGSAQSIWFMGEVLFFSLAYGQSSLDFFSGANLWGASIPLACDMVLAVIAGFMGIAVRWALESSRQDLSE